MAIAEKLNEIPPLAEADRPLLKFETFTDYLDSLIGVNDIRNLNGLEPAREIAALGYRHHGVTLIEEEFYSRREKIHRVVFPPVKIRRLASEQSKFLRDNLSRALADRERANLDGQLSTIVFIRYLSKNGFEISGYIDYADRLKRDPPFFWPEFFRTEKKKLFPKDTDLGYYHWRHGTVRSNITKNYIPSMHKKRGLVFQNRHDHKYVWPHVEGGPGISTVKQRVYSSRYIQIELYDHTVRRLC